MASNAVGVTMTFNSVTLEIQAINGVGIEQGAVDTTTLSDTYRTFIPGRKNTKPFTLDVSHKATVDWKASLVEAGEQSAVITLPLEVSSNGTQSTITIACFVTDYELSASDGDDEKIEASITFQPNGAPTLVVEAA